MLLNELKQIFETDRDALAGALSGLDINLDRGSDGDTKGGDVDNSLQDIVEDSVVTARPQTLSTARVKELSGTMEAKEKTLENLANLAGTLRRLQSNFTIAVTNNKNLDEVAQAEGKKTAIDWINAIIANYSQDNSTMYAANFNQIDDVLTKKRDNLVRTLTKLANAESYGRATSDEIKNFLNSDKFKGSDGNPTPEGLTKVKDLIELFYGVLITLQKNTTAINNTIAAQKPADQK